MISTKRSATEYRIKYSLVIFFSTSVHGETIAEEINGLGQTNIYYTLKHLTLLVPLIQNAGADS
jgi:hypothetical protein